MLHRRDAMIGLGQAGLGALTLPALLRGRAASGESQGPAIPVRARHCIFVFLWGGPPGQDLWDLKPDAPEGVRSRYAPIPTTVPGLEFCDRLSRLALVADRLAVVRSLTHASPQHDLSVHHALTGRPLPAARAFPGNQRQRSDWPFFGSVLSHFLGPRDMPGCVSIPRVVGHDGVRYAGTHGGFLGARHDPLELGHVPWHVNEAHRDQPVESANPLSLAESLDPPRLAARRSLLSRIDSVDQALARSSRSAALEEAFEQGFRMVSSPAAREAFLLEREPDHVRDRYGRDEYGESLLLSRRLIEAGVRLVSVNWMHITPRGKVYNIWDTHGGIGDLEGGATGYGMLEAAYGLPALDRALPALLSDLAERGLLDETLVVAVGEFGRTPRVNGAQGRDHWPQCYSALLAGGGIRGGQIYGASDAQAAYVRDKPAAPEDLLATIYHAFGLPSGGQLTDREGRPLAACDGAPLVELF